MTTRILVADDHPIAREGIRALLELEDDLQVVGEASDGREVLEMIGRLQPDIALLDLKMPGTDGLAVLQTLQHMKHASKIIVLTASEDQNEWAQAMKLGCSGIVLKLSSPELIVKSIRKVTAGEIWLDSHTTATLMQQFAAPGNEAGHRVRGRSGARLSNREREVVALVVQGYRNREMAEKLFISEQTVKNHLHNIFDKVGVSDRLELALYAIHEGLLNAA
ncbi:MAG: response regulator transcription factor [bacterium]|nr:response regulator transcription factor [bacterium]